MSPSTPTAQKFVSRSLLSVVAIATAFAAPAPAQAAALQLGSIRFSEVSGNYRITGGYLDPSFYTITQEVYGPDINLLMAIDGFPSIYPYTGIRVQTIVTNLTGTPWTFFDHELQETPGVPSPEADGLSFAQGIDFVRPFTSNRFAYADEVTDVRDFINFSGGVVAPGDSVIFQYAITDNSPEDRFFLLQRPNFQPGGGGFLPVPPPPPQPEPVASVPPTPTEPVPEPSPTASAEPTPTPSNETPETPETPGNNQAVPEPTTIVGVLTAIAGGTFLKRKRGGAKE
jgi:hypothetical protein